MTDALQRSIHELYHIFARYSLKPHVDACPHCTTDSDHALIHAKPLRELQSSDLERYAFKAMTTWGDEDDFRHFLPRLLELVVSERNWIDEEVLIGKLAYGHWETWPGDEQSAVRGFLMAWWRACLLRYDTRLPADCCLCAIAQAESDVTPYLAIWSTATGVEPIRHLANFVREHIGTIRKRLTLGGGWWGQRPAQTAQIVEWLTPPATVQRLESAAVDNINEPWAEELMQAAEALKCMRSGFSDSALNP